MLDLGTLDAAALDALVEHVGRVKHDLGKYAALRVRWLPPAATLEERREALGADLLATRSGPSGAEDAPSLWRGLRRALVGEEALPGGHRVDLSDVAEVRDLDAAMAEIEGLLGALRGGAAEASVVDRGTSAALRVSDAARELSRRVREARR